MIHYHGLPITPATAAAVAIRGGHAFLSFAHPGQLGVIHEVAQSFGVDNGAFSAWKSGHPVRDWTPYYRWVEELRRMPHFDFAVIPDVIVGFESENDALMDEWPHGPHVGAPVWHLHESLDRLERLSYQYPRVCLGSSGDYSQIKTVAWWRRMAEVMDAVCDEGGFPRTKLHGLRMLDPEVFTRFPFASADSTNIGQNVGLDSAWRGTYQPANKEMRAIVMRDRIESHQSPIRWDRTVVEVQGELLMAWAAERREEAA